MATYAIGDVQGCYDELRELLEVIAFDRSRDRLWFVGDLVNRGPQSLEVLRFARALGNGAVAVLGNHDLHLLCVHAGFAKRRRDDTLDALLAAPDSDALVDWLRRRPMMHVEGRFAMVHAGLLPQWTVVKANGLAREVENALAGANYRDFLAELYGNEPREWRDTLESWDRLRLIVNVMTRMRFCSREGQVEVRAKGRDAPAGYAPWFDLRPARDEPAIICGHWSTLGLKLTEGLAALDTGCVWGGSLSALRLDDRTLFQTPCPPHQRPGAD